MGITATAGSSKDFELVPPNVYAARCFRIIDLGTQSFQHMGKDKSARKVLINWELSEKDSEGRPFIIGNKYTLSLHEKALLRKDLESWRGRKFTAQELEGFDIENLLGKPCMLNVVHSDPKGGKVYANIASIMQLPAGMQAPQLTNKQVLFSLQDYDQAVFESLSDGLKKMIMASPEYQQIAAGGSYQPEAAPAGAGNMDDDIPFADPMAGKYVHAF